MSNKRRKYVDLSDTEEDDFEPPVKVMRPNPTWLAIENAPVQKMSSSQMFADAKVPWQRKARKLMFGPKGFVNYSRDYRRQQVLNIISQKKRTMDAANAAYKRDLNIRRKQSLTTVSRNLRRYGDKVWDAANVPRYPRPTTSRQRVHFDTKPQIMYNNNSHYRYLDTKPKPKIPINRQRALINQIIDLTYSPPDVKHTKKR